MVDKIIRQCLLINKLLTSINKYNMNILWLMKVGTKCFCNKSYFSELFYF